MLEHVYERAKLSKTLDYLTIATCDKEIYNFSKKRNYNVIIHLINMLELLIEYMKHPKNYHKSLN